jgi:hypothetical protein
LRGALVRALNLRLLKKRMARPVCKRIHHAV